MKNSFASEFHSDGGRISAWGFDWCSEWREIASKLEHKGGPDEKREIYTKLYVAKFARDLWPGSN